ncbi:hypothetical protein [Vitiosangium sp. GDMCC 1.1324]|uniref:hypothetical protein n=1 Tax=Vitiosangium sp. (strain GDMCC 1.1324) TaxID=2138576 RepID=UPI000D390455|nr:hypothetical protein [Vitiosangium sp. GDMCC 1.1324]PTL78592.1 hypothetical protein DAT35_39425 [Vitiosangium sp. GDMCC 1.1324]
MNPDTPRPEALRSPPWEGTGDALASTQLESLTPLGFRLRSLEREARGCASAPPSPRMLEQLDTVELPLRPLGEEPRP